MKESEIHHFRDYVHNLDASYDEYRLLINILITEAAIEYMHMTLLQEAGEERH